MLSAVTAKAQTAVEIQTSSAPSDGQFAEDTHWFTIYLRGTYLSVENVDDNAYFRSGNGFNTIDNTIDKGLWCVVGDDTNGYKFYNKSEGATKVLAINYVSGNTGGDARAKMVDASTVNATTAGADNWLTTFNLHKNTTSNVGAYSISVKGLTNYYLNQRSPYLAFWTSGSAQEEIGSSFYFYNFNSYISSAQSLADAYTNKTGGVFQPSAEELATFKSIISAATWNDIKTINSTTVPNFKAAIDAHKPVVGQRYLIKNNYNQKLIVPNVNTGSALYVYKGDSYKSKGAIWVLENGDTEGTYKIKNCYTGLYINGTSTSSTASNLTIGTCDTYNGSFAIGTGSSGGNTWFHANDGNSTIILWGAGAGASRWLVEEVSEEDYNALAALPTAVISNMINAATDILNAAPTEKAAFKANPTTENYQAYTQKVKANTDNQYVRFQCAKSGNNRFMGLNDGYTVVRSLEASTQKTNLSNIWKLVPVDGESGYKLMNANTGTYITNIPNATAGTNNNAPTLTDFANGYKFTFTLKNETNGNWNVIDGNNNKLNAETNGCVNYWTSNDNAGWWIIKASDIQVALHSLGDASYASLYLPFSISSIDGAEAYVANEAASNNTLVMQTTEDGGFAANQGVVLVGASSTTTATLTLGENSNTSLLSGTNSPVTLTDDTRANYLVFGPKDGATDTVGFWTPASSLSTIAANRAYYQSADGQAIALKFNGSIIEGINEIVNAGNAAAPIYDLTGRRVNSTLKGGIYIQNGKKFIVK